jgi:uncharacterized membrane protein
MNLPADLLSPACYWVALVLQVALVALAAWPAPWRRLRDPVLLNVWLGTIVCVMVLWSIRAGIRPGLGFHLLGASACTLMFGPRLAFLVITLATFGLALSGSLDLSSTPINTLVMGAVPIAITLAILRLVERRLPSHFFVYVFAAAFFGAGLAMLATGLAATLLLGLSEVYPFEYLLTEYLPWFILMAWAEAFTTGAAITLMVVYRPGWVLTFDDARYLRNK